MKKIFYVLLFSSIIFVCGCDKIDNSPTKKVEEMLMKYQKVDQDVLDDLNKTVESEKDLTDEQRNRYKEILKNQYKSLNYTIKNEEIDGDNAEVEVEIEVNDLTKSIKDSENYLNTNEDEFKNNNEFDQVKYTDYKLDKMENSNIKVKYTLELTLTKTDGKWIVDNLTETERQKIHGIYNY